MNAIPTQYRLIGKEPHVLSLALLSAFAVMGAILMTPALPAIAGYFKINIGHAQLTVTSFLLGYAIGQLIYGPLANRLGRKIALYLGIFVATLGSLFSILASPVESFHLLILGRILEALGASAGVVVSFTIINDFYYEKDARRITSLIMLAFAIVPGVAIAIGGILTQYLNWQTCFYFLLVYGLILIYPACKLPETLSKPDPHALHYQHVKKNYTKILRNKKFVGYSLCSGFSSACIYLFGAEGPFIGIHLLHIAPATYGFLGLTPFIGTLIGCGINIRLTLLHSFSLLKIAFLIELTGALSMFLFFFFHVINLATLLIPMGILFIGHPMLASTTLILAINQTEDRANGSAAANFLSLSMPVVMTFLLGILAISNALIMPLLFLIALGLMLSTYFLVIKSS